MQTRAVNTRVIDYIIINHAEEDHAGVDRTDGADPGHAYLLYCQRRSHSSTAIIIIRNAKFYAFRYAGDGNARALIFVETLDAALAGQYMTRATATRRCAQQRRLWSAPPALRRSR